MNFIRNAFLLPSIILASYCNAQPTTNDVYAIDTDTVLLTLVESVTSTTPRLIKTDLYDGDVVVIRAFENTPTGNWYFVDAYEAVRKPGVTIYNSIGDGWISEDKLLASAKLENSDEHVIPNKPGMKLSPFWSSLQDIVRAANTPQSPQDPYNTYIQQQVEIQESRNEKERAEHAAEIAIQSEIIRRQLSK